MWFNKNHPRATYLDIRPEVNPTVICDTRALPPEVGDGYSLVVFDPPHVNCGANSTMSKTYGYHTTEEIRDIVAKSAAEAHRVCVDGALMALKWNDHDQKLERMLALVDLWWEPLFGQRVAVRTRHASATYWVLLARKSRA